MALPVHGAAPPPSTPSAPAPRPPSDLPGLTLSIQGMHCASCVTTIENALSAVPGVEEASVNLATARAEVRGRNLAPPRLIAAVRESGYDARTADETAGRARTPRRRARRGASSSGRSSPPS